MNIFKRLFRLFRWKAEDKLDKHEDEIRLYEEQLKKSKESIQNLADAKAKLRAERRSVTDKKQKAEEYVDKLTGVVELAAEQKDYDLGERTIALIESNQRHIEMHTLSIEKYDGVIQEIEKQHANLKEQYRDKMSGLDGLRAQHTFVKNMESINLELKNTYSEDEFDFGSLSAIEDSIQKKIYIEQERNKDFTPEQSIDQLVQTRTRSSKFEQLVKLKESQRDGLPAPETEQKKEALLVELRKTN